MPRRSRRLPAREQLYRLLLRLWRVAPLPLALRGLILWSTNQRFLIGVVGLVYDAEGRLLGQWRDELATGAPGRGLPPLAPNVELLVLDDQRQVAGQLRGFDRELGEKPVPLEPPLAAMQVDVKK